MSGAWAKARVHELKCRECRVSWRSWVGRIAFEHAWWRRLVDRINECRCACARGGDCGPCRWCGR